VKKILLILLILFSLASCRSTKTISASTKGKQAVSSKAIKVIENAKKYEGVRYKYGGTTKKGMDCSGLIYTSFQEENIALPRTTGALSKDGDWIDLKKVKQGDLVFFATKKNSRSVNHVGIVVETSPVKFIHSSSSRGVIISSLKESYWYQTFVQARRVL
jgi:cell wall-associated NlpC family hydrolase